MRIAVIGAGAFGGWSALYLLRAGHQVTLIDAWGPGNSRSSSGDETRVTRACYGPNAVYTNLVAESLPLWKESEQRWGERLLHPVGSLWMAAGDDSFERAAVANIREAGLPVEELAVEELRSRWPGVNWEGVRWAVHEPEGGFLLARRACQAVMEGLVAEGGTYLEAEAAPGTIRSGRMETIQLSSGVALTMDACVFACGPWLGRMFPEVIGRRIVATRQEVFYFGAPAGERPFPVWVDNSRIRYYGIPGNQWRGFKVAQDVPGAEFDASAGDRVVSAEGLATVRQYLGFRFPSLKDAPLLESRVCQYEMSPDGGLIVDRHPECENAWLVGGGSGHGFKFGPALGQYVARLVEGAPPEARFALGRLEDGSSRVRPRI